MDMIFLIFIQRWGPAGGCEDCGLVGYGTVEGLESRG